MCKGLMTMVAGLMAIALAGCHHDKPHEYGKARPPLNEIDEHGQGLQSKDVIEASDKMAMDLLADRNLNASREQWTVVVDRVENHTSDPHANLDIFIRRLRVGLAQQGKGRVQLIENRDRLHDLQSRELEQPGQSGAVGGAGIQPDYALYAVMSDLPNRSTNYYFCEFTLTNLHNRTIAWTGAYEVKVQR